MFKGSVRGRALVIAIAACAAFAAAPATASADSVGVNVYVETTLGGNNQLIVAYQCQVGALPVAASVTVRCGVRKFGQSTAPGSVALYGEGEILPNQPFSICWEGRATFLNGTTKTTSGCSPSTVQVYGYYSSYTP